MNDNRDPFIYKTSDFGQTWKKISDGMPKSQLSYVRCVTEDPNQKGVLFAGTGNGFYYSLDDGSNWTNLQTGLPRSPVSWVTVQKQSHDVVISTYGRGFYILDDITPLEQQARQATDTSVRFFTPRPAIRYMAGQRGILNFELKAAAKGPVKMEIVDEKGIVVREMNGMARRASTARHGICITIHRS